MDRVRFFRGIIAVVVCVCIVSSSPVRQQVFGAIDSPAQARATADLLTGFSDDLVGRFASQEDTLIAVLKDSTTPFLSAVATGSAVWKVDYRGVQLRSFSSDDIPSGPHFDFEVYLDSTSGKLLKIECHIGTLKPEEDAELGIEEAEKQLQGQGDLYIKIPDTLPKVTFAAALTACRYNPLDAEEVLGQYILFSQKYMDQKTRQWKATTPKPVWIISLKGTPPIEPIGGPADWMPLYMRNRIRQLINATTGRLWKTSTLPAARLKPEDRERLFDKSN